VSSTTNVQGDIVVDEPYSSRFILGLFGNFFIFVTFGVVAPILGFVMFLAIGTQTFYMEYRIAVHFRALLRSDCINDEEHRNVTFDVLPVKNNSVTISPKLLQLDRNLSNIESTMSQVVWQALLFIGPFYGMFIFDIIGDEVGYKEAIWAPLSMCILSLILYIIPYGLRWYFNMRNPQVDDRKTEFK